MLKQIRHKIESKSQQSVRDQIPPNGDILIFAHGAKGSATSPEVVSFYEGYAATGRPIETYTSTPSGNLTHRITHHQNLINTRAPQTTILGGRSIGARASISYANAHPGKPYKLVLVSYPLENYGPDGKMEFRDAILLEMSADCECLFIIGSKDHMCDLDKLYGVREKMKARSALVVVEGAAHLMTMKEGHEAECEVGRMTGRIAAEYVHREDRSALQGGTIAWDATRKRATWSGWR